jgi:hypothetical protein
MPSSFETKPDQADEAAWRLPSADLDRGRSSRGPHRLGEESAPEVHCHPADSRQCSETAQTYLWVRCNALGRRKSNHNSTVDMLEGK